MKSTFERAKGSILVPVDQNAEKLVESVKIGEGIRVEAKKIRNYRFHKKFFALLKLGFDMWEPSLEHKGQPVEKNFDRFREEVLILAGHCDQVFSLNGSFRLVAKSVSYSACDELEFRDVYEAVLRVIWNRILKHNHFKSIADVDSVVNQLMGFA